MKKHLCAIASMLLLATVVSSCAGTGDKEAQEALSTRIGQHVLPKSRTVELTCVVTVTDIPPDAKELELWIPYPSGGIVQHATERMVETPNDYRPLVRYDRFGTPYLFLYAERPLPPEFRVEYSLKVERDEFSPASMPGVKAEGFTPHDLAPVGDVDTAQLQQILSGIEPADNTVVARARAICEYVADKLEYEHGGDRPASVKRALDTGRGSYLDYAMTTVALLRAADIPARVESGYLLPEHRRPERTPLTEAAAWVVFYAGDVWLCTDPCLADRYPELAEYMFSGLCANRVQLTTGPDRGLKPVPKTHVPQPFIRAFAEVGEDKPVPVRTRFFFRDAVIDESWEAEP